MPPKLSGADIREKFLAFYESKGHTRMQGENNIYTPPAHSQQWIPCRCTLESKAPGLAGLLDVRGLDHLNDHGVQLIG